MIIVKDCENQEFKLSLSVADALRLREQEVVDLFENDHEGLLTFLTSSIARMNLAWQMCRGQHGIEDETEFWKRFGTEELKSLLEGVDKEVDFFTQTHNAQLSKVMKTLMTKLTKMNAATIDAVAEVVEENEAAMLEAIQKEKQKATSELRKMLSGTSGALQGT